MDMILGEIEKSLGTGQYYAAIALALTLPDICSCLEDENGDTTGRSQKAYIDWYDRYVAEKYPSLTGVDCYSLRNGVIHNGRFGHGKMQYDRVLFTLPNNQGIYFHNNIINDALNLDVITFCQDLMQSTRRWEQDTRHNPSVEANLPKLVQFRPGGLAPYMVGMPLIA